MKIINQLALGLLLSLAGPSWATAKQKSKKHKKTMEVDKEPWACVKNGKIIKVKGKNNQQKQDHCQAQFGIWEKERHALEQTKGKSRK